MGKLVNDLNRHTHLLVKEEPPVPTTPPSHPAALPPHQSTHEASVKSEPQGFPIRRLPLLPPMFLPKPSDISAEIHQLGNLATAIRVFHSRFDELQKHFDFIDKAIETRSSELAQTSTTMPHPAPNSCATSSAITNAQLKQSVTTPLGTLKDNNLKSYVENLKDKAETAGGSVANQLLISLCKLMCSRGFRKYMVSHLSDIAKLREQVPLALQFAPNPAKLVLESVGRFYRQGSKVFTNPKSPQVTGRDASILMLECFLLSGCAEKKVALDFSVKNAANSAAIIWKKKLIAEGGLSKAGQIDARGLLMLVAGFGIPAFFKAEDLTDIIRVSNAKEIAHVLRKSHVLCVRIPDIIEGMIKKGLTVEAVDFTYIFGFGEKFSPETLLTSFLMKSEGAWEKARQKANGSCHLLKESNEKYLAALKSVLDCLKAHKIDWMTLFSGWKIEEKIANMTRGVAGSSRTEEKVSQKRKVQKMESSNKLHDLETKRLKSTAKGSSLVSPSVSVLQYHHTAANVDGKGLHDDSMPESLSKAGLSSHLHYPVASSAQTGCAAGSLLESVHLVDGGVMPAAQIGCDISPGTRVNPKESDSGYVVDAEMDHVVVSEDKLPTSSRLYGVREVASCNDMFFGQRFACKPASPRPNSLLGKLPSLEGFPGLLDGPNHSASTDLYSFVEAVMESESDP